MTWDSLRKSNGLSHRIGENRLIEKKKERLWIAEHYIYVKSFMAHQSSQRSNEMGTSQEKMRYIVSKGELLR